jgi:hypothetical protein
MGQEEAAVIVNQNALVVPLNWAVVLSRSSGVYFNLIQVLSSLVL